MTLTVGPSLGTRLALLCAPFVRPFVVFFSLGTPFLHRRRHALTRFVFCLNRAAMPTKMFFRCLCFPFRPQFLLPPFLSPWLQPPDKVVFFPEPVGTFPSFFLDKKGDYEGPTFFNGRALGPGLSPPFGPFAWFNIFF